MARPFTLSADRVIVIAELSANHGQSIATAIETIEAAAAAGADAIKIQTYRPETMTLDSDRPEFAISGGLWDGRRLYELYAEAQTPWEWHADLQSAAERVGLPLFSTPFDRTAVDLLAKLHMPAYKIASFELVDLELIAYVAEQRKPIIMSTGMGSLEEIARAVGVIRRVWSGHDPGLALLHCVSAYPAPPQEMNLATIPHLGRAFGVTAGLSDHTLGIEVAVASVALGARIIEKHLTLSRAAGGPDAGFSLEPAELAALVQAVRITERAVGEVHYGPTAAEAASVRFRRSIFIVQDIAAGEPFTRDNLRVVRPGHGLPPHLLPSMLGRKAAVDCTAGTPLKASAIDGLELETLS